MEDLLQHFTDLVDTIYNFITGIPRAIAAIASGASPSEAFAGVITGTTPTTSTSAVIAGPGSPGGPRPPSPTTTGTTQEIDLLAPRGPFGLLNLPTRAIDAGIGFLVEDVVASSSCNCS